MELALRADWDGKSPIVPSFLVQTHIILSLSGCRSPTYLFVCLFLTGNKVQKRDGACNLS